MPRTKVLAIAGALAASTALSGAAYSGTAVAAPATDCGPASGNAGAKVAKGSPITGDHDTLSAAAAAQMDKAVAATAAQRKAKDKKGLPTITINVRVHKIKGTGKNPNPITTQAINDSIEQLNKAYSGGEATGTAANTQFRFVLKSVDVTRNENWYRNINPFAPSNDKYTVQMKNALHVGGAKALNLYFVKFRQGLLGFATFPSAQKAKPALDGVVVDLRTAPGGSSAYNGGDTATHEIGHWLGLRHVFNDRATGDEDNPRSGDCVDNDGINDTVIQAYPTAGCTTAAYICQAANGKDNKHNYMDYSSDDCLTLFTSGQSTYMTNAWATYRDLS